MDVIALVLIAIFLLLPVVLLVKKGKSKEFIEKLEKLPGPKTLPILGNAMDIMTAKREDIVVRNYERFKKYGPVSRTWFMNIPVAHFYSAECCEILLSSMKNLEKSLAYVFLQEWLGEGLLTSKGLKWQRHRKMITPAFHFKILENFQEVMVDKSNILLKCLEKASANGQSFNVFPYITNATLDIICETAMGTNIQAQENPKSEYVSAVYLLSEILMLRLIKPWFAINAVFRMSKNNRQWKTSLKVLHDFTEGVIKDRKLARKISGQKPEVDEDVIGRKGKLAFLDLLLDIADRDSNLTDIDIRNEVDTFMFEGHDTTTAGVSWTIYLLGFHPEIQQRAYQEIEEIFNGEDRSINVSDLAQMKYVERIIKESLRLYPPVPSFGRKLEEDVVVHGYTVPAGTYVSVHTYALHRNPDNFPNPDVFDPDNFLQEKVKDRHPYAYVPFSAGPRNCIGQKFALNEEKTMLASILRKFKIKLTHRPDDIKLISELILRPSPGIYITLEKRK